MRYRQKRARQKRRRLPWLLRLAAVFAVVVGLLVTLDNEVRPVVITMAQNQARVSSILAINEAVLDELEKEEVGYDDLVTVTRLEDGTVSSIQADTTAINRLKARLTNAVSARLTALQLEEVEVPVGTLLGWQIFAGRGPVIRFQIVPASFVESDITSTLEAAGINQTQHKILMQFKVEMSAIIPGYTTSVTVNTQVSIADTLIVGNVPQFYAVGDPLA